MNIFLFVIFNNIIPIFIIVYLGYLLASKFKLDIFTLSKVYIYLFIPTLAFVKVYQTEINMEFLKAMLFGIIMVILLAGVGWIMSKILKHKLSMSTALSNSIMLYNSANFGLPLIMLVFGNTPYADYAISIQIMILVVQSLTTYSIGFLNAGRGQMNYIDTLRVIVRMPAIYAIIAAVFCRQLSVDLTQYFFWPSIEYLKNGLVPIALITLGAQLHNTKFNFRNWDVYIASLVRLIGGPILAYLLINIMGIDGIMGQVLFISSAVPTAVNTALMAVEFNNEPDFASQVVMTSTIFSAITLSIVIYLSQFLFSI